MNARQLYALYCDAHAAGTGERPSPLYDLLSHEQRMMWTYLAESIDAEKIEEISDAGG